MRDDAPYRLLFAIIFLFGFAVTARCRRKADRQGGRVPRSRREEAALIDRFDEAYRDYRSDTGRFLPGV